jgi:hypothetical protein
MEVFMPAKRTKEIVGGIALLFSLNFFLHPEDTGDKAFRFPEKNFETPEAAINHFVSRLADNDLAGAFEACAVNEGDRFDFKAMTTRLNAIALYTTLAPSQSPVLAQVNRITLLARLANQVKFMVYSLLTDVPIDGTVIPNPDEQMLDSFVKNADSRKLAGLAVVKIRLPASEELYNSERAKKMFVAQALPYGADDTAERLVLYKLHGYYYAGGVHLFKYGKYWRIDSLSSALANTSALGNVTRITEEQFDRVDY